jgi:hypothetical protein
VVPQSRETHPSAVLYLLCRILQDISDAVTPILLDYFSGPAPETELVVTFEQCEFSDIVYFGLPSRPTVIEGNSKQNRIIILDSNFLRNDFKFNNTNVRGVHVLFARRMDLKTHHLT